ncbi:hypothetical protein QAD02_024372 [Eretmocerus hayati]|uniref:Uncharacterized protein n=1 Tax=Eretmocerus hayati TaxID=131215 RepID=A0ACC2PYV9_9HYME|nr:hypothetical protein QAD02_024372 [Eretmocerus hayati]
MCLSSARQVKAAAVRFWSASMAYYPEPPQYYPEPQQYYPEPSSPELSLPYYHPQQQPGTPSHQSHQQAPPHSHQRQSESDRSARQKHGRAEIQEQISRHHDLERGLDRIEQRSQRQQVPSLAQVVMEECREAKIRRQVSVRTA